MATSPITHLPSVEPIAPSSLGTWRLQSGDHMDRETFHRRYLAMPPEFRAELVDGVVIVPSPTSPQHGRPHSSLAGALWFYDTQTPGTRSYNNTTVFLNSRSEVQPDSMLIVLPEFGGRMRYEDGHLAGGPDFIGEIAYSSESYDLFSKRDQYERAGVLEYFVLLLRERRIAWFTRESDRFQMQATADGIVKSRIFPGLWLDEAALLEDDGPRVLTALQRGVASPEHAEFVKQLQHVRGEK